MHRVQCNVCRNDVEVALYFSDKRIITHDENALNLSTTYEAFCRGEAICPLCGCNTSKVFRSLISHKDIVDLAIGE
jgi:hypothetical protein